MQPSITHFILKAVRPFPGMLVTQFLVSILYAVDLNLGPYIIKMMLDASHLGGLMQLIRLACLLADISGCI